VTSPNFTRVEVIEAAVSAVDDGADLKGVAPEKPVGRTLYEADRIIDLVEGAGPRTRLPRKLGSRTRYYRRPRPALGEGTCGGRPYIARSQAEHGGPHSEWFWDGRKQGGGALTDMLCHALGGNEFLLTDPGW